MQSQFCFFQWKFPITSSVGGIGYLLLKLLPFLWDQLQTVSLELITSHVQLHLPLLVQRSQYAPINSQRTTEVRKGWGHSRPSAGMVCPTFPTSLSSGAGALCKPRPSLRLDFAEKQSSTSFRSTSACQYADLLWMTKLDPLVSSKAFSFTDSAAFQWLQSRDLQGRLFYLFLVAAPGKHPAGRWGSFLFHIHKIWLSCWLRIYEGPSSPGRFQTLSSVRAGSNLEVEPPLFFTVLRSRTAFHCRPVTHK